MGYPVDISGRRFGRLIALHPVDRNKSGNWRWLCLCDCGNRRTAATVHLRTKAITSCGCTRIKHLHTLGGASPEYRAWRAMKERCLGKTDEYRINYKERGIIVHPGWVHSFESFLAYVGLRPSAQHSLDRIDNNGSYVPGNVRWATKEEQSNNRRVSLLFTFEGRTLSVAQWAREKGIARATLYGRISRGMTIETALTQPINIDIRNRFNRKTVTIEEELERCRREQEFIQAMPWVIEGTAPAWLVAIGMFDWEIESLLILEEATSESSGSTQSTSPYS